MSIEIPFMFFQRKRVLFVEDLIIGRYFVENADEEQKTLI